MPHLTVLESAADSHYKWGTASHLYVYVMLML